MTTESEIRDEEKRQKMKCLRDDKNQLIDVATKMQHDIDAQQTSTVTLQENFEKVAIVRCPRDASISRVLLIISTVADRPTGNGEEEKSGGATTFEGNHRRTEQLRQQILI